MRRVFIFAAIILTIIVAVNIHSRPGNPVFNLEKVSPFFSEHEAIAAALAGFLKPGTYVLYYFGIDPETGYELIAAMLMSWWAWLTAVRLLWHIVGRPLGIVNMADFHWWIRVVVPWRPIYRPYLKAKTWWLQYRFGTQATACFTPALAAMATLIFERGDNVYLGRLWGRGFKLFQTLGISGSRHVTVVASSGSGKTRWLKALLGMIHKNGAALVIDSDAEISNALAAVLERKGHRVYLLDPYRLGDFPGACWNALEEITRAAKRHGRASVVRFAQTLAEALIREDNKCQPVFAISARGFMHGLCLYVWLFEPPERRNLIRVRELLARGMPELITDPAKQDGFDMLLKRMMQAPALMDNECDGQITAVIARAASLMKSGKNREGSNPFRATAMSQTAWLALPEIAAISQRSDFAGEDLKTGNTIVFICAPVTDIQEKLSGWTRALTMMTMYAFQNMPGKMAIPCAFLLDEMPSLRIEMLDTAAPVFRRFGVRLVAITQDLEKLRQAYPDSWRGFIGNSQCVIWMGNDEQDTLEYLCKELGTRTITERIEGSHWFWRMLGLSKTPARYQRVERPLMYPHQLHEFLDPARGRCIVTRAGKPPLRIGYDGYDTALPVWDYTPDKSYREPFLRASTRSLITWLWPKMPQQPRKSQGAGS